MFPVLVANPPQIWGQIAMIIVRVVRIESIEVSTHCAAIIAKIHSQYLNCFISYAVATVVSVPVYGSTLK